MLMCVSFFAVAQDLKIDGGVQMDVSAEQDVNASIGKDSIAAQSIGAIESGDLSGDIQIGVEAAEDVNAAIGDGACAQQEIGTIGKKDSC
tara:strand:- start:585 stop:854 length:270 start_codon:yes stop_codon:yes gene_type:complete